MSSFTRRGAEAFQLRTTMWSDSSTRVTCDVTEATCCSIAWLTMPTRTETRKSPMTVRASPTTRAGSDVSFDMLPLSRTKSCACHRDSESSSPVTEEYMAPPENASAVTVMISSMYCPLRLLQIARSNLYLRRISPAYSMSDSSALPFQRASAAFMRSPHTSKRSWWPRGKGWACGGGGSGRRAPDSSSRYCWPDVVSKVGSSTL
mmetsp:Transcript_39410/g.93398  ORF Transcript_39410/g.93398 Transcript_39410/m.93398 type:complete len:205 (-) Transcript_39410:710-1324(-)